jgi:cytochrome c-type biogenesis protein CcmH
MILVAALVVLAAAVLGAMVLPLVKPGRAVAGRAQFDRAVYRDQLDEVDRDVTRGLLTAHDAVSARIEIERRLLATDTTTQAPPPRLSRSPILAGVLVTIIGVGAAGAYLALGTPGLPDTPFAARNAESDMANGAHGDFAKEAAALAEKLKSDPNNFDGWQLLGRTEASFGHWQQSADAYHHALTLHPDDVESATGYGEMLVLSADGTVTQPAQEAFSHAVALDPTDNVAHYYLALGDAQTGKIEAAIATWQKVAATEPADSALRAEVAKRIDEAFKIAGMPAPPLPPPATATPATDAATSPSAGGNADAATAIEQMPEVQRNEVIRSMVAKLAQRLEAKPDDPDGWTQLGRSYLVLGDNGKAADAYDHAAQLKPNDAAVPLQEVDFLAGEQPPGAAFSPRMMTLLHRIEAINPDQPDALWYLGLAAANDRHGDEARHYWQRLMPLLPAGSEQSKKVVLALQNLPEK